MLNKEQVKGIRKEQRVKVDCRTKNRFLYIISNYSISKCWDNRRAVREAIINIAKCKYKYDLHSNARRVLVLIGERNRFNGEPPPYQLRQVVVVK